MNPNQPPGVGFTRPLTEEAMKKEFVVKMKREHILIIYNMFATQNNYTLGDAKKILEVLDYFKDATVLTDKDFVPLPKPTAPPTGAMPPIAGATPGNGVKV